MIEFLISWAEQLIIALMIIVMIEMIIPNSSYRKYIKIILGIFILYVIFNPLIKNKTNNFNLEKEITNQIKASNIATIPANTIDYNKQIEIAYKEKFEENLKNNLKEKGYDVKKIKLDINYDTENLITNKLELIISKNKTMQGSKIEKVEISKKQENITQQEIDDIKKEISSTYDIEISKILIESENANG